MFSALKQRWAEARVGPVTEYVRDILLRYKQMNPLDRDLVLRAFQHALSELEDHHGPKESWGNELRKDLAAKLFKMARSAASNPEGNISGEMTRISANGVALLSFYIEMQGLSGPRAIDLVAQIEEWSKKPSGYNPSLPEGCDAAVNDATGCLGAILTALNVTLRYRNNSDVSTTPTALLSRAVESPFLIGVMTGVALNSTNMHLGGKPSIGEIEKVLARSIHKFTGSIPVSDSLLRQFQAIWSAGGSNMYEDGVLAGSRFFGLAKGHDTIPAERHQIDRARELAKHYDGGASTQNIAAAYEELFIRQAFERTLPSDNDEAL